MQYYTLWDLLTSIEKLNHVFFFRIPEQYRLTAYSLWKQYGTEIKKQHFNYYSDIVYNTIIKFREKHSDISIKDIKYYFCYLMYQSTNPYWYKHKDFFKGF